MPVSLVSDPSLARLTPGFKQSLGITTAQYNLIVTVSCYVAAVDAY